MLSSVIVANISYNPTGWRNLYRNPRASHSYATKYPGHESLNFNFSKNKVDTVDNVFGYIQWTADPKNFENGGTIIFYSRNTDTGVGEIVGLYGNALILYPRKIIKWPGFENNEVHFNIKAEKGLSMLFPIPLVAEKYKESKGKRLVGQIGYSYYDIEIAIQIMRDELIELKKSGVQQEEFLKLKRIYTYLANGTFEEGFDDIDLIEQEELAQLIGKNRKKIIDDLNDCETQESETIVVNHKTYKRDNKTIAQIKVLRNYECQICKTKIVKANGGFYVEAAHIKPKSERGFETPDNILILCPNHHKEFDYGVKFIINHDKKSIEFLLNGEKHIISLKVE